MRIAYLVPAYPPDPTEPFVVNEMVEVAAAGHEVVVAALYAAPPSAVRHGTYERLRPAAVLPPALLDVRVIALAVWTLVTRPWRTLTTLAAIHWAAGANPFAHLRLLAVGPKALATAWRLRRLGVDRIHAHFANERADCAAIAGRVAGIPFSFTAHAFDIYATDARRRNATLAWKLRHAVQAFAVSEYGAARLRRHLPPAEQGKVHVAYVGIPLELFREEPPAPAGDELVLLAVARLQEKKGLDTLVDACALVRDLGVRFALSIYGDGPLRESLAAQVARLGLADRVRLGGSIPQEEVARRMRECHALVLPCRRDRRGDMDGIPTVFMEAMATGRPVVSTAISGIPELVRDGETGLVVPPDDPQALAAAIVRLARDEALRVRLGHGARALVERQHDERRNARRLLALMGAAGA
ncbi:MAG TPA: glycosyltransferase [Candidatus Binatia bacterium]|jgi:glycosyltransferase involved in cell wall biosynthesis|nr:glycosyltransferase [Candidatus Binatia bacterium]